MPRQAPYQRLKAAGKCVKECGRDALPNSPHCKQCLARHTMSNVTRSAHYNYLGLCRECAAPIPPDFHHVRCPPCYTKNSEGAIQAADDCVRFFGDWINESIRCLRVW
jgi:hypothetical protein